MTQNLNEELKKAAEKFTKENFTESDEHLTLIILNAMMVGANTTLEDLKRKETPWRES